MKSLFTLFIIFSLVSCKKQAPASTSDPLPAQNLIDLSYGNDAQQKMDVFLPAGRSADSTKLIILVHGGSWIGGDKADLSSYIPGIKQRLPDYAIANINYRLASADKNHFPTQEMDMKAAVDFLLQKTNAYHISQKIVLLGASAGGHLVLLQAYKYNSEKIKAVVDFFGPTDMVSLYNTTTVALTKQGIEILLAGTPAANPGLYQQSSPIHFVTPQSTPTIMFHGSKDVTVSVSQSHSLKGKLESNGVIHQLFIYPDASHGPWTTSVMNDAFNKIEMFLKNNVH